MNKKIGIAILAAGLGTRLKLKSAKALAPICGRRLIDFPISEAFKFAFSKNLDPLFGIVTGAYREDVESYVNQRYEDQNAIRFAFQKEQLGTADALRSYFHDIQEASSTDYTLVLCADTPLIRSHHLEVLVDELEKNNLDGVAAVFETPSPKGYGRIIKANPGFHIVEEKDASEEGKNVTIVNSGLYLLKTDYINQHLESIGSENKSGEFYLTDIFQDNRKVQAITFESERDFLGVNTLEQLSNAAMSARMEKNKHLMSEGVLIVDHRHTYIDYDVEIGPGSTIMPGTHLLGSTVIGSGAVVEPGCFIKNSDISDNVHVKAYSYFESAKVGESAAIGPYARLREGTDIGPESKIGNFVETKKSKLDRGVKVSHLSYVGDAEIGENTNIGCGFITCNYDGANKHKTIIGKDSFIGSDSQMIAPVTLGDRVFVGSGSTINQDIPSDAMGIARTRQVTKEGMAKRFLKTKK